MRIRGTIVKSGCEKSLPRDSLEDMSTPAPGLGSLIDLIAAGKLESVEAALAADPTLTQAAHPSKKSDTFHTILAHHVYGGDTALHVAAAAHAVEIVDRLLVLGSSPHARNRRGAQPLHYACDGGPMVARWDGDAQGRTVRRLLAGGADPAELDASGVSPLHRAVRCRCTPAVKALLEAGAGVELRNGGGSTPLHLAVQTTGRGGSGSEASRREQRAIVEALLDAGASVSARDGKDRTVLEIAPADLLPGGPVPSATG